MNWITTNFFKAISDFMSGILDVYGDFIGNVFETITDANVNNSLVGNVSNYTMLLALVLLAVLGGKQILDVYVFQTAGDPNAEPLDIVVRIAQAVAVICSGSWIFNELMKFSKYFTNDLLSSAHENDVSVHLLDLIMQAQETITMQAIGFIFTLVIILIGFVIFSIVAGIRGAELILMKVLFPFFAMDLITTNRERWKNFFTCYVITFCTYGIQMFCFKMCSMTFVSIDYNASAGTKFLIVIGWIILMIRSPRWIEKFAYTSGVSSTTTSFIRMAPLMLMRR